ncbi:MAG: ABC transporter permease subunit, partial [Acidimicrobiia bacterium]|nr:ABC transporter permease subunit [Acidimicrobiia bacterium]
MLSTVFTKSTRDRSIGMAIAVAALGLWLLAAMAIYRDIDLSLYTDLPEAMRGVMGIPEGADVASLAYSVMFSFAGALTLAGMAISLGTGVIAGEERKGTLGLLLGNPKSRTHVLISKAGAMVLLTAL